MGGVRNGKQKPSRFGKDKKHFGASGAYGKGQGTTKTKSDTKKTIQDCCYYVPTSKQAHDFHQTTEFIINHIRETMEYGADIAEAVKNLKPANTTLWRPHLEASILQDQHQQEQEQRQFDFQFQEDYKLFKKREVAYELNLTKSMLCYWEDAPKE